MAIPNFFAVQNLFQGAHVHPLVGPPAHFLPRNVRKLPRGEQAQRLQFWGSAMLLETAVVCALGTLAMLLKGREAGRRGAYNRVGAEEGGGEAAAGGEGGGAEVDGGSAEVAPPGKYQKRRCDWVRVGMSCDMYELEIAQKSSAAQYLLWRLRSRPDDPATESYEMHSYEEQASRAGRVHHLLWRVKNSPALRMQVATGATFLLYPGLADFALSTSLVLWCSNAGLLSEKTGLPWEGYFTMLSLGNLWCLLQALCLEPGKFAPSAFTMAMVAAVAPFLSDAFDTFKDIQFGGLCLQAEHRIVRLVGVASIAYLAVLNFRILQDTVGAAELAETYLGVTFASVEHEAAAAGLLAFPEYPGKAVQLLYKQTTKEKQRSLLFESLPQGAAAVVFMIFEGGSQLVLASAVLMPLLQLLFAWSARRCLSKMVLPWIVEELFFAASKGNASKVQRFLKPLMEEGGWLLAFALKDHGLRDPTVRRVQATRESLPLLHAAMELLDGNAENLFLHRFSCGRSLGEHGFVYFLDVLRGHAGRLELLRLDDNSLGDDNAKALAEALKANTALQRIKLSKNHIGDEGAKALAEALKANTALQRIALKANTALKEIELSANHIGAIELGVNHIGDEGAKALAEALKANPTLQRIDLCSNHIGAEGAKALAEALKANTALQRIELSLNDIGDEGAKALAEVLKANTALKKIDLCSNHIGAEGAKALAEASKANTALKEINLRRNSIPFEDVKAFERDGLRL
ncbi:unnamed protein product [Prorocentrum cordatum]|uniref:Protein NLRC3 n=1 Tax=Prorocentrum cordatum TaxID=2364126 RepID=A0ABN9XQV4_9DINO|nr:unnamed protein product [Polarella glacialis]